MREKGHGGEKQREKPEKKAQKGGTNRKTGEDA
jgi:hypothetical protein